MRLISDKNKALFSLQCIELKCQNNSLCALFFHKEIWLKSTSPLWATPGRVSCSRVKSCYKVEPGSLLGTSLRLIVYKMKSSPLASAAPTTQNSCWKLLTCTTSWSSWARKIQKSTTWVSPIQMTMLYSRPALSTWSSCLWLHTAASKSITFHLIFLLNHWTNLATKCRPWQQAALPHDPEKRGRREPARLLQCALQHHAQKCRYWYVPRLTVFQKLYNVMGIFPSDAGSKQLLWQEKNEAHFLWTVEKEKGPFILDQLLALLSVASASLATICRSTCPLKLPV